MDKESSATESDTTPKVSVTRSESSGSESARPVLSRPSLSTAVSALGFVGGLLYVVLRTANAVFYNAFDVSPEDVGLGPLDTGVRSASALVFAVISGAVFIGFGTGAAAFLTWFFRHRLGTFNQFGVAPSKILELVLARLRRRPTSAEQAAILEGDAGEAMRPRLDRITALAQRNVLMRGYLIFGVRALLVVLRGQLVWAVGIAYSIVVLLLAVEALFFLPSDSANAVKAGGDGRVAWAGFDLLPWGAVRVDVAERGGGYSFSPTECYMYLGQANGTSIFYAVKAKETIRLPSSGLSIVSRAGSPSCPTP
jgi:hypothetical protein